MTQAMEEAAGAGGCHKQVCAQDGRAGALGQPLGLPCRDLHDDENTGRGQAQPAQLQEPGIMASVVLLRKTSCCIQDNSSKKLAWGDSWLRTQLQPELMRAEGSSR